jgi:hypothetical protein
MSDLDELTNELMKDPVFAAEYKKLEPEREEAMVLANALGQSGFVINVLPEKGGYLQGKYWSFDNYPLYYKYRFTTTGNKNFWFVSQD